MATTSASIEDPKAVYVKRAVEIPTTGNALTALVLLRGGHGQFPLYLVAFMGRSIENDGI